MPTFADDVTIASTSAKVHVTAATGSMVLKNAGTIILHDNLGATSGDASYRGTFTFVADSTNPTPTLSILSSLTFGQLDAQKGKLLVVFKFVKAFAHGQGVVLYSLFNKLSISAQFFSSILKSEHARRQRKFQ